MPAAADVSIHQQGIAAAAVEAVFSVAHHHYPHTARTPSVLPIGVCSSWIGARLAARYKY